MVAIHQPDAGALFASKCVIAHVTLAKKYGAVVREHSPLRKLTIHPDSVEVETPDATYTAAKLILVPGAWAKSMFASIGLNVPLTIIKTQECYFDAQPAADYEADRFPVFIAHQREEFGLWPYGLPSVSGSGLKTGLHGGTIADDPDTMDRTINQDIIDKVREFFRRHIPAGDAPVKYARVCLYTNTPDEHFVVDKHPLYPHVIISSSCSGHGFKFSNVIGEALSQLAIDGATTYDIDTFRLARFDHVLA
jgi:monomeric sarcosine oxidase